MIGFRVLYGLLYRLGDPFGRVTTLGWATELVIVGRLTCDTWVTICDSTIELVIVGWLTCDSWATIYGWASELVIVGRFTSSRVTKGVRVGWLLTNFLFGVCLSTSDGADRMRVSWATCTVRGRESLANPLYDLGANRHKQHTYIHTYIGMRLNIE